VLLKAAGGVARVDKEKAVTADEDEEAVEWDLLLVYEPDPLVGRNNSGKAPAAAADSVGTIAFRLNVLHFSRSSLCRCAEDCSFVTAKITVAHRFCVMVFRFRANAAAAAAAAEGVATGGVDAAATRVPAPATVVALLLLLFDGSVRACRHLSPGVCPLF